MKLFIFFGFRKERPLHAARNAHSMPHGAPVPCLKERLFPAKEHLIYDSWITRSMLILRFKAYFNMTLSCVREEKLAVLFSHVKIGKFEIWITTKIEAEEVLWGKFLTVEMETGFYTLTTNNSFFIDEEKKVAMGIMGYSKTFKIVGEAGYLKNWNP